MSYEKTRAALVAYDREQTSDSADLVRVAFWLETDSATRVRFQNPSIGEIRAVLTLSEQHQWEFYANGSFCRKCGASIGSGQPCR